MPLDIRKPRGSPKPIKLINRRDFTGGLNLASDTFKLLETESPELLNVDVDRRGGIEQRKALGTYSTNSVFGVTHMRHFQSDDADWLVAIDIAHLVQAAPYGDDANGTFSEVTLAPGDGGDGPQPTSLTVLGNNMYFNSVEGAQRWDGSALNTAVTLGQDWNDDYAIPTDGNMPKAELMCDHLGYIWVGSTNEADGMHPNRVRYSHPNKPERWRELDYIDVDVGHDGEAIKALIPFQDQLLVIKQHSVYAIYGFDTDTFGVSPISVEVGSLSYNTACSTPAGVFFYDRRGGVFHYDGHQLNWIFTAIFPAIERGDILPTFGSNTNMAWLQQRLWLTVPWLNEGEYRTFVWDPTAKEGGTWTAYDLAVKAGVTALDGRGFVHIRGADNIQEIGLDLAYDRWGNEPYNTYPGDYPGATLWPSDQNPRHIESYFRTPWIDEGQPAIRKRWKRMETVMRGGIAAKLPVEVYVDYDGSAWKKRFVLDLSATTQTLLFDEGNYDEKVWGSVGQYDVIAKGSAFGQARAVSLKFYGPVENLSWGLDAFVLKYKPKRIR